MRLEDGNDLELYPLNWDDYKLVLYRYERTNLEDQTVTALKDSLESRCEKHKIAYINPRKGNFFSRDKMTCFKAFQAAGIPTPETVYLSKLKAEIDNPAFHGDLVVKPTRGSNAAEIYFEMKIEELIETSNDLPFSDETIVQPQIETVDCFRVIVCENTSIAVYKKNSEGFLHAGINIENLIPLHFKNYDEIVDIALKMHNQTGLIYSGADVLAEANQIVGLEVNSVPGIPRIEDAKKMADVLIKKYLLSPDVHDFIN